MSAKYSTGGAERVLTASDGRAVALTDHVRHRWRMRTPPTCQVGAAEAFRRSEPIKDPSIVFAGERDELVAARVFKMHRGDDEWTAVFLVVENGEFEKYEGCEQNAPLVIPTVLRVRQVDHGPTRAYLNSHGPHYCAEAGER